MRCLHSLLGATQVGGVLIADGGDDDVDAAVDFGKVADDVDVDFGDVNGGIFVFGNPKG